MRAHGFNVDMLASLVRDRLATPTPETVRTGGQTIEVADMRITDRVWIDRSHLEKLAFLRTDLCTSQTKYASAQSFLATRMTAGCFTHAPLALLCPLKKARSPSLIS